MSFLGKEGKEVCSEEKKSDVKVPGVKESPEPGQRWGERRPGIAGQGEAAEAGGDQPWHQGRWF